MIVQSKKLFIFSFLSFIFVFIFGAVFSPIKKVISDPEVLRNFDLFHNHFDQLCWLGAAAIGATFYFLRDKYNGSHRLLNIFTTSYMFGTLIFSGAFLIRGIGLVFKINLLHKSGYILMISIGGLLNVLVIISACFIVHHLIFGDKQVYS